MRMGIIALFTLMTVASCGHIASSKSKNNNCCSSEIETKATESSTVESNTIEVLYMHGKQRCATCVAIGIEASKLIEELANDNVVMKTIDFSTPEGEKIADSFEIASSSLIVVKDGKVENLTAIGFQHARNNPELFKKSLRETIEKMLE